MEDNELVNVRGVRELSGSDAEAAQFIVIFIVVAACRIFVVMIRLLVVQHDPPLCFLGGIMADGTEDDAQQWMFVGVIHPCDENGSSSSSIDWMDKGKGRAW